MKFMVHAIRASSDKTIQVTARSYIEDFELEVQLPESFRLHVGQELELDALI